MDQIVNIQTELNDDLPPGNDSWDTLRFRSRRAIALLGYLAAERRPVSRAFLAGLLWPDDSPSDGRANLRRELYSLTQLLPDCWQLDRQAVAFIPSANLNVDIYMLLELETQDHWIQAADLLGGEFLEALHLGENLEFDSWLTGERNRWQWRTERILAQVVEEQILRGRYRDALQYSQRLLQFAPWNEEAHRKIMRLLAWTGQRGAALHHFDTCRQILDEELDIEPSAETVALFKQIQSGELDLPPQLPAFLAEETARHEVDSLPFFARERELEQLHKALDKSVKGHGRVLFVTGDPGRGKTALMRAFAQQAMAKHSNLLVVNGSCNAYSGIGEPYLPFREIMAMLTGDVETKWDTGAITREHASRLWEAFPIVAKALLEHAPNALGVLVQRMELQEKVTLFELTSPASWQVELKKLITHQHTSLADLNSSFLFQQIVNMLQSVAQQKPLLIIIDDLQWADHASISLLFNLGRKLAEMNNEILIVCALRPEEVFIGSEVDRRPLVKLINEFKRNFGDEWVELGQTVGFEARRFVDAVLDSEPNRLGEDFRSAMLQRTGAHPLFTIELLHTLQEKGDLFRDEKGNWIVAGNLNWNILPAKVEAVIKERVERLDPDLQEILTVGSIEGEVFTAEVIAEVQGREERSLLRQLSMELEQQHRLVREQEGFELNGRFFSRFKFTHILFQNYFYERLCEGERRKLHASVANAFESLYKTHSDIFAVQLAHHLHQAGDYCRAFRYYIQAAEQASSIYANEEAISHYSNAIDLISENPLDEISYANLYRERGCVYEILGQFDHALIDFETALPIAEKDNDRLIKWRTLINLGKLWASRDYNLAKEYLGTALDVARDLDQPELIAENLNWIGNWHTNADEPQIAFQYHQEALSIIEKLNAPQELANTLDLLGISHLMGGNLKNCVNYYEKAISLYRELDNRSRLASSLTGCAASYSLLALLVSVSTSSPLKALSDVNEAIQISEEISSSIDQSWPYWALGLFYIVQGQFEEALNSLEHGLQNAIDIQHNEFIVGLHFGLGLLYIELFDPDLAVEHLQQSQAMARELDSRIHFHISSGLLAGAYLLRNSISSAQNCLNEVISENPSMDTIGKRLCWLRQAEIALIQEKPEQALKIIDQLITTAPGIETGDVITYLWMLKGETLGRLGSFDEANIFLKTAIANAQEKEEKFLLWRAHASLGQLYSVMNHPEAAVKEFSLSKLIIEEICVAISDRRMKDKFRRGASNVLSSNTKRRKYEHG